MIRPLLLAVLTAGCAASATEPPVAALGAPAPDFALKDLDGVEHVKLADTKPYGCSVKY
jgi:hypothetical protein